MNSVFSNFPSVVQWRAEQQTERLAFEFVSGDELEGSRLTYGALAHEADRIGAALHRRGADGRPVAIVLPPGLALITAFFGAIARNCKATLLEPPHGEGKTA